MSNQLIINASFHEIRVALLENGIVAELYFERAKEQGISGNIYKGKVVRILPGMQAAFVDIGLEKAAFLYVTDFYNNLEEFEMIMREHSEEELVDNDYRSHMPSLQIKNSQIQDLLKEGQEILVQVSKEPLGNKGARITSHISLPGRHLVLLPTIDHIGISRRIKNEKERKRLREFISKIKPHGIGFIIRTASEGKEEHEIMADMEYLLRLWNNIQKKKESVTAPCLLYQELDMILRLIRDLFTPEVEKVVIDSKSAFEKVMNFVETFMPELKYNVELYDQDEALFDAYGIEDEISRTLGRRVWLKSGGYIIIEMTEALTAIDVNTGRYVGKRNLEDTIIKTNLEAVKEIAYQLRLRNIGGIIIIDFIDMEKEQNREKVYNALAEALKRDKAKTNILKISELGLVEMTRKRIRENITQMLCEPCPYCEGKGLVKSKTSICYEIFREIHREGHLLKGKKIILSVHPDIADLLYEDERVGIEELERKLNKTIIIKVRNNFHIEQYEITSSN